MNFKTYYSDRLLGDDFDADQWVKDFKEAGAQHLAFYDKWIDGLVFHDTKTTNFKTKRDFVGELAAACQRAKLPLIISCSAIISQQLNLCSLRS